MDVADADTEPASLTRRFSLLFGWPISSFKLTKYGHSTKLAELEAAVVVVACNVIDVVVIISQ